MAPMVVAVITAGGVFYAYLWDRSHSVWPAAIAHGAENTMFSMGAAAVVTGSEDNLAYVAGESGIATFTVVAVSAVIFLARAKVWRTDKPAPATKGSLEPVA